MVDFYNGKTPFNRYCHRWCSPLKCPFRALDKRRVNGPPEKSLLRCETLSVQSATAGLARVVGENFPLLCTCDHGSNVGNDASKTKLVIHFHTAFPLGRITGGSNPSKV